MERRDAGIADRPGAIALEAVVRLRSRDGLLAVCIRGPALTRMLHGFFVVVPLILGALVLPTPHAHVTSNADTAALLGNSTAERSALGETWELLGAEDGERLGLDLKSVRDVLRGLSENLEVGNLLSVHVFLLLQFLVQGEAEAVFALMPNRQIREDEVAYRRWTIEVGHTSNRRASQDGNTGRRRRDASLSQVARVLQGREQEEAGVVLERDVYAILKHEQLDNGRRVDGSAIGRGYVEVSNWSRIGLRTKKVAVHFAPEPHALARSGSWMTLST